MNDVILVIIVVNALIETGVVGVVEMVALHASSAGIAEGCITGISAVLVCNRRVCYGLV